MLLLNDVGDSIFFMSTVEGSTIERGEIGCLLGEPISREDFAVGDGLIEPLAYVIPTCDLSMERTEPSLKLTLTPL